MRKPWIQKFFRSPSKKSKTLKVVKNSPDYACHVCMYTWEGSDEESPWVWWEGRRRAPVGSAPGREEREQEEPDQNFVWAVDSRFSASKRTVR